jgi:hypothetical protein
MTYRATGPVFDGRARAIVDDLLNAMSGKVAQQGYDDVRTTLHGVLRHPTGNYEAHISVEHQRNDWAVNDHGIVYGPWLEGVGSRNQTTRFKGYFTFRRVSNALQGKVTNLTRNVVETHIKRMNA